MNNASSFLTKNMMRFYNELKEFLAIPSVSAEKKYLKHIHFAGNFLVKQLKKIGFKKIKIFNAKKYPIIIADFFVDSSYPTVLFYAHYDVQPSDPIEEWEHPPFKPYIKDNNIYARGASDNKGPLFIQLKAVETYLKTTNKSKINIKFVFDPSEEIGSLDLITFMHTNPDVFKADVAIVADTTSFSQKHPTLATSLRGLIYLEIILKGAKRDLHSGQHGGIAPNPIMGLTQIMSKLKDENQKVLIPGFYDNVQTLSSFEKQEIKNFHFEKNKYQNYLGVHNFIHDQDYDLLECLWFRPTLDFNGIKGGYLGKGQKTVIPHTASLKLSMRLVNNQNPDQLLPKIKKYLEAIKPEGFDMEIIEYSRCAPIKLDFQNSFLQKALIALNNVYQQKPIIQGVGESIPVVLEFQNNLDIPVVLFSFGYFTDNIHSPNEHFSLDSFESGIKTVLEFLFQF